MSPDDLLLRLYDHPFKPFRLKLSTSETIDVFDPRMVIVSATSAILPITRQKSDAGFDLVQRWKTIALDHIVSFQDLDSENGRTRRKRPKR